MNREVRKAISIDPSGLGTTGVVVINIDTKEIIRFDEFKNDNWLKQLKWLIDLCKEEEPVSIIYEATTFISPTNRGNHMTSLFKLFGGIESLIYIIPSIETIDTEAVNVVKNLKDRVLNRGMEIDGILFKEGRGNGWTYKGEKLSNHKLDAFMIYWWWSKNENERKELKKGWAKISRKESDIKVKKVKNDKQKNK